VAEGVDPRMPPFLRSPRAVFPARSHHGAGRSSQLEYADPVLAEWNFGTDDRGEYRTLTRMKTEPRPLGRPSKKCRRRRNRVYRREIAENPDVLEYFEQATARKRTGLCAYWIAACATRQRTETGDLRAIHGFLEGCRAATPCPAWFGVGHALEEFAKRGRGHGERLLREIARGFPVFSELLRNVEN